MNAGKVTATLKPSSNMTHSQALSFPCHDVATINSGACIALYLLLSNHDVAQWAF